MRGAGGKAEGREGEEGGEGEVRRGKGEGVQVTSEQEANTAVIRLENR